MYWCVVLQKGLAVFHVTLQSPPFIYLAGTTLEVSFIPIISMCLEPEGRLIEAFKNVINAFYVFMGLQLSIKSTEQPVEMKIF